MSIPNYQPRADYIGTGLVSSYTFDFKVTSASQIKIVKTDDTNVLVWEVTGDDLNYISNVTINEDYGGQIDLIDPLETDYNLYIILDANEPIQTKEFKVRKYWSLEQFEAAFDAVVLQLQAVAYLAKRAPLLGKLVNQNDADAFNMDIELVADAVVAINSTGDGFEAVARSSFVGDTGPAGANGADGADGTNGAGILRAGNTSLSNGQQTVAVVFSTPVGSANYVPNITIKNATDPYPIFLQWMITAWDVNGFTASLNAPTDSANYIMSWSVQDEI